MPPPLPLPILENLRFLVAESQSQLSSLQKYFDSTDQHYRESIASSLLERSGYAHNLKTRIQNACLQMLTQSKGDGSTDEHHQARSLTVIASELERISQLCRECVQQGQSLRTKHKLNLSKFIPFCKPIINALNNIEPALLEQNSNYALKVSRSEDKLDSQYQKIASVYTEALKQKNNTEDYLTGLSIARSLEHAGASLMIISESLLSLTLGQHTSLQRYDTLHKTVQRWSNNKQDGFQIKTLAETRSGSAISSISVPKRSKKSSKQAVFKEGKKHKLKEELSEVNRWNTLFPGIAPEILTYHKNGDSAALLIEHLPGLTFEQIVLDAPPELMDQAVKALGTCLRKIYKDSRVEDRPKANFVNQIQKRFDAVCAVHPYFNGKAQKIHDLKIPSIETLLKKANKIEQHMPPPFSVLIHGDFNIDNILFDPQKKKIHFIDLHRSKHSDYVQDVSVFMISHYRLQVLEKNYRLRIYNQIESFYKIMRRYAQKQGDLYFDIRLALGLARSFFTSTRFILDKSLARRMYYSSNYLLQEICNLPSEKYQNYRLPVKDLFHA